MSNPTSTSLFAAATNVGVKFVPLAIAPEAVTLLLTSKEVVGV